MSYQAHTEVYKGFTIKIHQDEDVSNPFTDCDGEPDFISWHRRYDFTFNKKFKNMDRDDFLALAKKEGYIVLPLYMYEHSGRAFSTVAFSCPWDSGQLGYVFWTREKVEEGQGKGYDMEANRTFLEKQLVSAVQMLEDWAEGNCYGYVVEREDGEEVGSCWGYLGDYDGEYGALQEAKSTADWQFDQDIKDKKDKAAADFPLLKDQLKQLEESNA